MSAWTNRFPGWLLKLESTPTTFLSGSLPGYLISTLLLHLYMFGQERCHLQAGKHDPHGSLVVGADALTGSSQFTRDLPLAPAEERGERAHSPSVMGV